MSLGGLASVADLINALAVVVTLIVLIVSIRQNTRSQRAVAVDSLAAAIAAINVPAIESPAVGSAVARVLTDWFSATRDERIIAHYFLFSFFKLHESAWYQQREGILDSEQWRGWEQMLRKYYHSPGVRDVWWPVRRGAFSREFQDYLASTGPPQDVGDLSVVFDDFKNDAGQRAAPDGPR
jgi:hypothetical protein